MPDRRPLTFGRLTDAVADAEKLHRDGYEKAGNWDLSQVCRHLTAWLTYPLDGFPKAGVVTRSIVWVLKQTAGRWTLKQYLAGKAFPTGAPTYPQSVFPPGDQAEAVAAFRAAVRRFDLHAGKTHPSPFFGPLTKAEGDALQRIHAAHHLSFLVPKAG